MKKITIREEIRIEAPLEIVWDFTQDWNRRTTWDRQVIEVIELREKPERFVKARFKGGEVFEIRYKLSDRPRMTTLSMTGEKTRWFESGGGSWRYEADGKYTRWVQIGTMHLRKSWGDNILRPLFEYFVRKETRFAMKKAKSIIEARLI